MTIQPHYVTFEQAKLLKEKGFDATPCKHYNPKKIIKSKSSEDVETMLAPEQWMVTEWLRIKHGIWIEISPTHVCDKWGFDISVLESDPYKGWFSEMEDYTYDSPQAAYSAAIDYVLRNLI